MSGYRQRSESPYHISQDHKHERRSRPARSRSPSKPHASRRDKRHHSHRGQAAVAANPLPLGAQTLSKHNLHTYRPLFALYLDVQKGKFIEDLPEDEVKGRWKSFVKKWNTGDLAEGWYDAKTFEKATKGTFGAPAQEDRRPSRKEKKADAPSHGDDTDLSEDGFGPDLPTSQTDLSSRQSSTMRAGPAIPSFSDIRERNEQMREDATTAREQHAQNMRAERKDDRRLQTERLNELAPKSEPGSRERQLEKKREAAASNRDFAAAKEAGGDVELQDADVMGGGDSLSDLKRMKEMEQRKKTEREVRREEILRTRAAERDERLKGMREKEAKTMEMLQSIARARFGGQAGG